MSILAGQLNRLKQVPKSSATVNEFPGIMEEVVDFIQKWLENWTHTYQFIWDRFFTESVVSVKYILVAALTIQTTSDGRWQLETFLGCTGRTSMLLSGASGCALTLVDIQQRLADWIYRWMGSRSIVDEAFEEVLSQSPS